MFLALAYITGILPIKKGALVGYSDRILLVGVNYDAGGEGKKKHTCVIEEGTN